MIKSPIVVGYRHTGIITKDIKKSLDFYHKILGMPIKNQRDNWVDLGQSGGSLLSLHPAEDDEPHSGTSIHNGVLVGLIVGDIESVSGEFVTEYTLEKG